MVDQSKSEQGNWLFYIGSYSEADQPGIHLASLNQATGEMKILGSTDGVENPSFLAVHPGGHRLYAVTETDEGELVGYDILEDGSLKEHKRLQTGGEHPCHVAFAPEAYLVTVNYTGAQVSSYKLDGEGRLEEVQSRVQHTGSGPNKERQEKAHTHSAIPDKKGKFVYVSDLGKDQVVVYGLDQGKLAHRGAVMLPAGSGPRHFIIDSSQKYAYGIDELSNTFTVYNYNAEEGGLVPVQQVSTLPPSIDPANCTAADLHLSACGGYLYGSNRGASDTLVRFVVNRENGQLSDPEWFDCGGKVPRNFALVDNRLLLCANQDSDNIVSFLIDPENGKLKETGHSLKVGKPVCIAAWHISKSVD
ncbi:hypothetical protein AWM70_21050 [Paenibacillus yonginensis]|uniref:6-phosphogluconolactonase n=1 Tax=Paenibacillus yonginensis TaxID=1462996 RepID=A0A1B1N5T0_9BACL|nr:lactonase family protein [Paenibacillus yonginensis]ANS76764.1 hypothetical protein AWM70_21050 [Paenibacillus yonginensis]